MEPEVNLGLVSLVKAIGLAEVAKAATMLTVLNALNAKNLKQTMAESNNAVALKVVAVEVNLGLVNLVKAIGVAEVAMAATMLTVPNALNARNQNQTMAESNSAVAIKVVAGEVNLGLVKAIGLAQVAKTATMLGVENAKSVKKPIQTLPLKTEMDRVSHDVKTLKRTTNYFCYRTRTVYSARAHRQ